MRLRSISQCDVHVFPYVSVLNRYVVVVSLHSPEQAKSMHYLQCPWCGLGDSDDRSESFQLTSCHCVRTVGWHVPSFLIVTVAAAECVQVDS